MGNLMTRALVLITIPLVFIIVTAGLAQLVLSWQHRNGKPTIVCPRCHGEKFVRKAGKPSAPGDPIPIIKITCYECDGHGLIKGDR